MPELEDLQHDILLIIATGLFILFALGIPGPGEVGAPVVFPPS